MSWRTPTEADLLTRLSGDELTAFREAALAESQEDPVEFVLEQVVETVGGYIAGHRQNTLGAAGTLPAKLIGPAMDMALMLVMSRAAGIVLDPSGARAEAAKAAERLMVRLARGKFAIEEPAEAADDDVAPAPSPRITARTRTHSRANQDGI